MENVYKVRIKSNPDPRNSYPSERRYSASIVLGLGVVHLVLSSLILLLSTLGVFSDNFDFESENSNEKYILYRSHKINLFFGSSVISLSGLVSASVGFLAWKRWYIDQNIKWFFIVSISASVLILFVLIFFGFLFGEMNAGSFLSGNIFAATVLELIWCLISAKVASAGMSNAYPDEMVLGKGGGKIEINTVKRGKLKPPPPPDILDHFPKKAAKHFERSGRGQHGGLPKVESNAEYVERFGKFLDGNVDSNKNELNVNEANLKC